MSASEPPGDSSGPPGKPWLPPKSQTQGNPSSRRGHKPTASYIPPIYEHSRALSTDERGNPLQYAPGTSVSSGLGGSAGTIGGTMGGGTGSGAGSSGTGGSGVIHDRNQSASDFYFLQSPHQSPDLSQFSSSLQFDPLLDGPVGQRGRGYHRRGGSVSKTASSSSNRMHRTSHRSSHSILDQLRPVSSNQPRPSQGLHQVPPQGPPQGPQIVPQMEVPPMARPSSSSLVSESITAHKDISGGGGPGPLVHSGVAGSSDQQEHELQSGPLGTGNRGHARKKSRKRKNRRPPTILSGSNPMDFSSGLQGVGLGIGISPTSSSGSPQQQYTDRGHSSQYQQFQPLPQQFQQQFQQSAQYYPHQLPHRQQHLVPDQYSIQNRTQFGTEHAYGHEPAPSTHASHDSSDALWSRLITGSRPPSIRSPSGINSAHAEPGSEEGNPLALTPQMLGNWTPSFGSQPFPPPPPPPPNTATTTQAPPYIPYGQLVEQQHRRHGGPSSPWMGSQESEWTGNPGYPPSQPLHFDQYGHRRVASTSSGPISGPISGTVQGPVQGPVHGGGGSASRPAMRDIGRTAHHPQFYPQSSGMYSPVIGGAFPSGFQPPPVMPQPLHQQQNQPYYMEPPSVRFDVPEHDDPTYDSSMMVPGENYSFAAVDKVWSKESVGILMSLWDLAERYKWKYVGDVLTERQNKRIPLRACRSKFEAMFGETEASSLLQSSLPYVAYRSGWDAIQSVQCQHERDEPKDGNEEKEEQEEEEHEEHEGKEEEQQGDVEDNENGDDNESNNEAAGGGANAISSDNPRGSTETGSGRESRDELNRMDNGKESNKKEEADAMNATQQEDMRPAVTDEPSNIPEANESVDQLFADTIAAAGDDLVGKNSEQELVNDLTETIAPALTGADKNLNISSRRYGTRV